MWSFHGMRIPCSPSRPSCKPLPEVELPDDKGIPVSVPRVEVTDHDIDHEMEQAHPDGARRVRVSDRSPAAVGGPCALVDFKTELDGVPVGDVVPAAASLSWVEGPWMPVQESTLLPGFTAQISGQTIGEIRVFGLSGSGRFQDGGSSGQRLCASLSRFWKSRSGNCLNATRLNWPEN